MQFAQCSWLLARKLPTWTQAVTELVFAHLPSSHPADSQIDCCISAQIAIVLTNFPARRGKAWRGWLLCIYKPGYPGEYLTSGYEAMRFQW